MSHKQIQGLWIKSIYYVYILTTIRNSVLYTGITNYLYPEDGRWIDHCVNSNDPRRYTLTDCFRDKWVLDEKYKLEA